MPWDKLSAKQKVGAEMFHELILQELLCSPRSLLWDHRCQRQSLSITNRNSIV